MAFSLLAGAVKAGLAADKPTAPDAPAGMCQLYVETDTGKINLGIGGETSWRSVGGSFGQQAAPAAKTGDATLTIAEMLAGLFTCTKATAVAFTLPTGTLTDAGFNGGVAKVNDCFDWAVINLGSSSGAMTLNAGTDHTIVGNAVVAISTTGVFRTRKTGANTYVTYRVA